MDKLKPCPFCNEKRASLEKHGAHISDGVVNIGDEIWSVFCMNCWAGITNITTQEKAIKRWNRRATDEPRERLLK